MGIIVAKFGGSSLADAKHFQKVKEILCSDPSRRYVVPSAPGKRFAEDDKVTDMLYTCHRLAAQGAQFGGVFSQVAARYRDIAQSLGLAIELDSTLAAIEQEIVTTPHADFAASRGEYLGGLLLASYLGWPFLDPAQYIFFDSNGVFDSERTQRSLSMALSLHHNAVIPGFYGSMPDGSIRTFSRGGSDVTGAIVARAADAALYENWTDVPGFLMADPRIVPNPKVIEHITYRELRELSYMGATVLHEDAIFPVRKSGIPINIRDTNQPEQPGTMIVLKPATKTTEYPITGIAGRKGFSVLSVEKAMMNAELGFGRRVLQAAEECGISFEHLPTGIDTMCIVMNSRALEGKRDQLVRRIYELTEPDSIEIHENLALIATVGRAMVLKQGTAAKLFTALRDARVNVRMIDQGSSELNLIVGVNCEDFERAVNAIYQAFVP